MRFPGENEYKGTHVLAGSYNISGGNPSENQNLTPRRRPILAWFGSLKELLLPEPNNNF